MEREVRYSLTGQYDVTLGEVYASVTPELQQHPPTLSLRRATYSYIFSTLQGVIMVRRWRKNA